MALLELGVVVRKRSIRRYRGQRDPRRPSQTRRAFLVNHRPRIWSTDFFTIQTRTFRTLYVLSFVAHGRREIVHIDVRSSPTSAWVWRRMVQATPWGRAPRAPKPVRTALAPAAPQRGDD